MKFERTCVSEEMMANAIYGMRNPKNSWHLADSKIINEGLQIGPNDTDLAKRLIAGGPVHAKFLRQIPVSVQITAPSYWWPEMDQYKVGTVTDSTSKMHKLLSNTITEDCFEDWIDPDVIERLEYWRQRSIKATDEVEKRMWWDKLLHHLPMSWLQTRMWTANYEVLRNIYKWRKTHKLTQWREEFINWIESLPNSWLITEGLK